MTSDQLILLCVLAPAMTAMAWLAWQIGYAEGWMARCDADGAIRRVRERNGRA